MVRRRIATSFNIAEAVTVGIVFDTFVCMLLHPSL